MKNLKVLMLIVVCLCLVTGSTYVLAQDITVNINDEPVVFDVAPVNVDGRILVPMRKVFEAVGAGITWVEDSQTVFANKGGTLIVIQIGNNTAFINNAQDGQKQIELDVPAQIIDGRTLVPMRFIGEALGGTAEWDGETQTVSVSIP